MRISSIVVDGVQVYGLGYLKGRGQNLAPVGDTETYTFSTVSGNHTIHAEFDELPLNQ